MLIWYVGFFIAFLHNSCNFQYLILGWSTLVLSPSFIDKSLEDVLPKFRQHVKYLQDSFCTLLKIKPVGREGSRGFT